MTKRTCNFVFDRGKKRILHLTLVKSNFEHCSTIWRPVNIVHIRKFEALQKQAIKWINCEEGYSYTDELYAIRCKQADILPLQLHFELNDLVFFYKIKLSFRLNHLTIDNASCTYRDPFVVL